MTQPLIDKSQVENLQTDLDDKLDLTGDTMSGPLILAASPTTTLEAATKQYVDSIAAGLDPKESVRAATTADVGGVYSAVGGTGGTGEFTNVDVTAIDTISLNIGDRLLVKDQTLPLENGIYVVTVAGATGTIERSDDMDGTPASEISPGNFTYVTEGAANTLSNWMVVGTTDPIIPNTDPINWTQLGVGSGVTDHTLLTNIGVNTHVQIDTHVADATIHFTQAAISITESQISDLGTYEPAFSKNTGFNLNLGTTAGTVSVGNHLHTGVYEPADATILKDADIGTSVQAFDTNLGQIAALSPTKGNLLVGNGSAWNAVGVGTNGQVLEADSAQALGVKWATPTGVAPAFRGAWATRSGLGFQILDGVATSIPFEAEVYDTDTIHDNVTNNTRLTVPAGVTKIRLTGAIRQDAVVGSISRSLNVYKNGALHNPSLQNIDLPTSNTNFVQVIIPIVIPVTGGDYFEMKFTPFGGNVIISNFATHFAMEIIE